MTVAVETASKLAQQFRTDAIRMTSKANSGHPTSSMSAADLLKNNPNPSETEIREYLEGNLCRCTGYDNIVKSIQAAAAAMNG